MSQSKYCIIAYDASGSITMESTKHIYWSNLEKTYNQLIQKYGSNNLKFIQWNHEARCVTVHEFVMFLQEKRSDGGTSPERIWRAVQRIVDAENRIFDIVITTDGQVGNNRMYIKSFNELTIKPDQCTIYFWGIGSSMNMSFLDGLPPPVTYFTVFLDENREICTHTGVKVDGREFYNALTDLPEYKLIKENTGSGLDKQILENLYIAIYRKCAEISKEEMKGEYGNQLKRFVDQIQKLLFIEIYKKLDFDPKKFDEAFQDVETNLDYIIDTFVLCLQSVTVNFSGQSVLSKIQSLANGYVDIDRKLTTYGKDSYKRMKNELSSATKQESVIIKASKNTEIDQKLCKAFGYFIGKTLMCAQLSLADIDTEQANIQEIVKKRLKEIYGKNHDLSELTETEVQKLDGINFVKCPILLLEDKEYSSYLVLWLGEKPDSFTTAPIEPDTTLPNGNLLRFDKSKGMNVRRFLAKNPAHLFEVLSAPKLNERIPPANQQISIDAYLGLTTSSLLDVGKNWFNKSIESPLHKRDCYGFILYNAASDTNKLDAPMSKSEASVLIHNCSTLLWLLFGDGIFVGSYSLLMIYFLYILYQTDRLKPNVDDTSLDQKDLLTNLIFTKEHIRQQPSYIQDCIAFTIKRLIRILKCNLMLFSGKSPNLQVPIINAITFHTKIFHEQKIKIKQKLGPIQYEKYNSLRQMGNAAVPFLSMSSLALNLDFQQKNTLYCWLFWNYMCKCKLPTKYKLIHFQQIAATKLQKWQTLNNENIKLVLVEGSNTNKPYLDYLTELDAETIYQMIKLYEWHKNAPQNLYDISTHKNLKVKISTPIENIPEIECMKHIKNLDKETGELPKVCPLTNLLAKECHKNQRIKFEEFGYNMKTIYGHSYHNACKTWIIKHSEGDKMKLPTVEELMMFVIERTPLCVFPEEQKLKMLLEDVIKMYKSWSEISLETGVCIANGYWKKLWVIPECNKKSKKEKKQQKKLRQKMKKLQKLSSTKKEPTKEKKHKKKKI